MASTQISDQVLEQLHYICFPEKLSDDDLVYMEQKTTEWVGLPVQLHVLDLKNLHNGNERFFKAVKDFSSRLKPGHLVSLNLKDDLKAEITRHKLDKIFNVVAKAQDLVPTKDISAADKRRLLVRYLIRSAFTAVEVALRSTVSCDENYLAKPDKVPYDMFDIISYIDVRGDFLNAQFRLCGSSEVLRQLAARMLGRGATIDQDMVESMALELLNLIYGGAKSQLNDNESFRLPPAIPRLWRKDQFSQIKRSAAAQLAILPLVTPMGSFYVEVDYGV